MNDKLFVIGIGGTGMRCLEAFVHSCAIGMYDNSEINILALDTDLENGNYNRLKELVEDGYLKIKGYNKPHYALSNTFFSAKINFYKFTPDYSDVSNSSNFERLSRYPYSDKEEKDLANLLLRENIRTFDLKHGYRAQTHLGSMLMYHAITEEVKQNPQGSLSKYINAIFDATEAGTAKIFVLGSVFGGTGASSIPVIPEAFNHAINTISPGKSLNKAYFGANLLSSYFNFPPPDEAQRQEQKVVASSKNFALNSQVAMMFYNEDKTVKTTYQKFYMMGTPTNDYETAQDKKDTITGGARQKNDAHYIELLAAFATYDFFNTDKNELENIKKDKKEVQYYFRAFNENKRIDFRDFVSAEKVKEFAKKLGLFTAFGFFTYPNHTDFIASAQAGSLERNKITGYEDIEPAEVKAVKKYMELFHFGLSDAGDIKEGWLRQLHRSAYGQDKMLFHADMFGFSNEKELKKFNFNKNLYRPDETDIDKHEFKTGFFGSPFDSFKDQFVEMSNNPAITNKIEKLIKRMYASIEKLYKF